MTSRTTSQDNRQLPLVQPQSDADALGVYLDAQKTGCRVWNPPCLECHEPMTYIAREGRYLAQRHCASCQAKLRRVVNTGVPRTLERLQLSDFRVETDGDAAAVSAVNYLLTLDPDQEPSERPILTLSGPSGVGKTMLAALAILEAARGKRSAKFQTVSRMMLEIRDSYRENATPTARELVDGLTSPWIVCLDDLGTEAPTHDTLEKINIILDERLGAGRPTIFTTNYGISELGQRMTERVEDPIPARRILSRIVGAGVVVSFSGKSRRGGAR